MEAIKKLVKLGFNLWLDGKDICYEQKAEILIGRDKVSALLVEIKTHKEEARRYLQQNPSIPPDDPDADFIKANLIIKLHSDLIGENIYFCSSPKLRDECTANDPDTVAYLPHEGRKLSGLKPDEVKKLHYARKRFGGEFIQRNKLEDSIFTRTQEKEEVKNIGIYNPRLGLKNKIPTREATPAGTKH